MKKIIALMLVLLLTMTFFVACKNDPEDPVDDPNDDPNTEQNGGSENEDPDELYHDSTSGLENTNQHDGDGVELPIVPIQ